MAETAESDVAATGGSNILLLMVSWLWVGIPLALGVLETLRTSLALWD
jgi:hypothetical protein